jgi:hypothetical protein
MFMRKPWQDGALVLRRCDDLPGTLSKRTPLHNLAPPDYSAAAWAKGVSTFFSYLFARSFDLKTPQYDNASPNESGLDQLKTPPDQGREDPLLRLVESEIELALVYVSIARCSHARGDCSSNHFAITKAEISYSNASRWMAEVNGPGKESLSSKLRELRSTLGQLRECRDERSH